MMIFSLTSPHRVWVGILLENYENNKGNKCLNHLSITALHAFSIPISNYSTTQNCCYYNYRFKAIVQIMSEDTNKFKRP